jgi:nucleoside-diphosphate-sugar epimerase
VEDVAEGLLRLACADADAGDVVNVATGRLTMVREFATVAAAILGMGDGDLQFGAIPTRVEEMEHAVVTVERLRTLTGWVPPTTIDEGIRRTTSFLAYA